jgi:acetate kinase
MYLCSGTETKLLAEGEAEEIGKSTSSFWFERSGSKQSKQIQFPDHSAALAHAFAVLREQNLPAVTIVGHRFVHGGQQVREHQLITPPVMEQLRAAASFAPLHAPPALAVLEAVLQQSPGVPQVACLDTAFHRTMPAVAKTYALPSGMRNAGVERYGFHGLSLESVVAQLDSIPERVVVAHLGNGASVTAIRGGASIDTTMGLTPTGGVMMGTRCGDLDPGIFIYLLRNGFSGAADLETAFNYESGLLGVSGKTRDVRELLKARANDPQVNLALHMFCYQVRKAIASMAAALGGLDLLVFTGGIGENATEVRDEICAGLSFLGNHVVKVLASQEDLQIARISAQIASSPRCAQ